MASDVVTLSRASDHGVDSILRSETQTLRSAGGATRAALTNVVVAMDAYEAVLAQDENILGCSPSHDDRSVPTNDEFLADEKREWTFGGKPVAAAAPNRSTGVRAKSSSSTASRQPLRLANSWMYGSTMKSGSGLAMEHHGATAPMNQRKLTLSGRERR